MCQSPRPSAGRSAGRLPGAVKCGAADVDADAGCGALARTGAGSTRDPLGDTGARADECSASRGVIDGTRSPAVAGTEPAAGTAAGSCGTPAGTEGSCGPPAGTDNGSWGPPAPAETSGGVAPVAAVAPSDAPGTASGGCGVASTGASSGLPGGKPTGLPLTGAGSILGRSPVRPSRFLLRSPLVLEISAKAPRTPAISPSSPAALSARPAAPAASAASAPRAAAPAPSAAAPASPAPGTNSVATSKRFSPNPNPGRAVLQSSRCSNDLSICRSVFPAS